MSKVRRSQCWLCQDTGVEHLATGDSRPCSLCQDKETALNARRVPAELRRRFKIWCLEREVPMQDVVVELIRALVDGEIELDIGVRS